MTDGSSKQKKPDSCSFVVFGATGDLAHRLVLPALYNLAATDLLPDKFCVVGIARKAMSGDALRDSLMKGLREFATRPVDDAIAERLLECVTCIAADPKDPASFDRMRERLEKLEANRTTGGNRLFYLATPPDAFAPIARQLGRTGMLKEDGGAWRRLVVEKPFGTDLESAKALNSELLGIVDEHQIYRIDHYLGKETVQNILVLRFSNGMFEPIWNRNHIDHVQITVDEKLGVGHRGSFYDTTGALRDMVPNHLFQLLSLVAMEPPSTLEPSALHNEQVKVLEAIDPLTMADCGRTTVRGQYDAGAIDGVEVRGYREEPRVNPKSMTETYAAFRVLVDNWRWAGVPFYLRTGKRLRRKKSEVVIEFKQPPLALFRQASMAPPEANQLVISIQPEETIKLRLAAKVPGPVITTSPVDMRFNYHDYFGVERQTGYETLLYDAMTGDRSLFKRADMIEAGWAIVDQIVQGWGEGSCALARHPAGSQGPAEADAMLASDGRAWRVL